MSGSCSLVVTCWERADLLTLLYVMVSHAFVTFPYGALAQVWYLILDLCLSLTLQPQVTKTTKKTGQKEIGILTNITVR